jgi:hypothetical protein
LKTNFCRIVIVDSLHIPKSLTPIGIHPPVFGVVSIKAEKQEIPTGPAASTVPCSIRQLLATVCLKMEHTRIPIIYDHYKWKMMRNQQKPDKPTFLGGKEDAEIQAM